MPGKISMLLILLASGAVLSVLAVRAKRAKRVGSRNFSEEGRSIQRNVDFTQAERHLAFSTIHGDDQKGASPQPTVIGAATWLRDTVGISRAPSDQGDLLRFDPEIQEAVTYLQMSERLKIEKKTNDAQFEEEWDKLLPAEAIRLKHEKPASALAATTEEPPDLEAGLGTPPAGDPSAPTVPPLTMRFTSLFSRALGVIPDPMKNKKLFDLAGVCFQQLGIMDWNNLTFEGHQLPAYFAGVDRDFFDGVGSRAFMEMLVRTIEISMIPQTNRTCADKVGLVVAMFVDMIAKEVLWDRKDCCKDPVRMTGCNFCTAKCWMSLGVLVVNGFVKTHVKDNDHRIAGYLAIFLSILKDVTKGHLDMKNKEEGLPRDLAKWELAIAYFRLITFVSAGVISQDKATSVIAQNVWKYVGEIGENYWLRPREKKNWIKTVIKAETVEITGETDEPEIPTTSIDIRQSLKAGEICVNKVVNMHLEDEAGTGRPKGGHVAVTVAPVDDQPPVHMHVEDEAEPGDPKGGHVVVTVAPLEDQPLDEVFDEVSNHENVLNTFLAQKNRLETIRSRYKLVKEMEDLLFKKIPDDDEVAHLLQSCRIARLVCKNLNYPVPLDAAPPPIDEDTAFTLEVSPTGICYHFGVHEQPATATLIEKGADSGTPGASPPAGPTPPDAGSSSRGPVTYGIPSEVNLEEHLPQLARKVGTFVGEIIDSEGDERIYEPKTLIEAAVPKELTCACTRTCDGS